MFGLRLRFSGRKRRVKNDVGDLGRKGWSVVFLEWVLPTPIATLNMVNLFPFTFEASFFPQVQRFYNSLLLALCAKLLPQRQ